MLPWKLLDCAPKSTNAPVSRALTRLEFAPRSAPCRKAFEKSGGDPPFTWNPAESKSAATSPAALKLVPFSSVLELAKSTPNRKAFEKFACASFAPASEAQPQVKPVLLAGHWAVSVRHGNTGVPPPYVPYRLAYWKSTLCSCAPAK